MTFRTDDDVPKGKGAGYEYCSGGNKIKIRVTNEEDEVLSTTFGVAEPPPEDKPALVADWLNGRCTINAVLEGIPAGEKFYTIEAETGESQFNARSGAVTYSNAEMEAAQWKADLEITTSAE